MCKSETKWEENPYRPFCSKECKGKDLGNWATERYKIESNEETPPDPNATGEEK